MFDLALGDAAVCLLRPLWSAYGATQAGCGVELAVRLLQRTSTPQRLNASTPQRLNASTPQRLNLNLKLNRTAALTEWRQLLSA